MDAVLQRMVEPNECLANTIVEVDGVSNGGRVVAFAHQRAFGVLEGGGDVQAVADTQEYRTRVIGQTVDQVRPEPSEIKRIAGDDRRHASPSVGARNRHAVDAGLLDSGKPADRLRHFGGRDVLTLPTKGVADPIDEI